MIMPLKKLMDAAAAFKPLKYSMIALFLSGLTDILAGWLMSISNELFLLLPGLIILIPGAIGIRGAIFGALGSRLGSAMHLGVIEQFSFRNKYIKNNVYAAMTLTVISSVFLGFLAGSFALFFGFRSISMLSIVLISFIGGIIAGIVLLLITFFTSFTAYRRGWDPDDVTSPLITALGDFITIPALLISAYLVLAFQPQLEFLFAVVMIASAVNIAFLVLSEMPPKTVFYKEGSFKVIVMQSILILLFSGALSTLSGVLLQSSIEKIVLLPSIIILIPAFLEEGGNIGNILASRISTKLHLGQMDIALKMGEETRKEFKSSYILALFIFPVVAALSYLFEIATGMATIGLFWMIFVSTLAGVILVSMVVIMTFFISVMSFKRNLDPDNVTIPIIMGIADILGVLSLLAVLMVFGFV